jgi:predicted transcriptional regulator
VRQSRRQSGELESEVLAALDADLAYTTVMTTLARLHEKGAVHRERVGRAYAYAPSADVAVAAAEQMRRLLDRGDHASVLARFVGTLDDADGRVLRDLLTSRRQRRRSS